jgi:ADP-dependent NAD(P)H-hydrate dehydratase
MVPVEECTQLPPLPARPRDSNKGSYGRVLVVAGSRGMSGAAVLCGSAALRGGAGLVRVATPISIRAEVAVGNPCFMTVPVAEDEIGQLGRTALPELLALKENCDVVALGPGLGRGPEVSDVVAALLAGIDRPMVLDADGLNAVSNAQIRLKPEFPRILTPHPGEFARLTGKDTKTVQANRRELAVEYARAHKVIVVLKGAGTLVTDGRRLYENRTGNPGMATGGSGDVLTGLIAALLGQQLEPFAAAQLGVYIHGLAGDRVAAEIGEAGMIASDLLAQLPRALRDHVKANVDSLGLVGVPVRSKQV